MEAVAPKTLLEGGGEPGEGLQPGGAGRIGLREALRATQEILGGNEGFFEIFPGFKGGIAVAERALGRPKRTQLHRRLGQRPLGQRRPPEGRQGIRTIAQQPPSGDLADQFTEGEHRHPGQRASTRQKNLEMIPQVV